MARHSLVLLALALLVSALHCSARSTRALGEDLPDIDNNEVLPPSYGDVEQIGTANTKSTSPSAKSTGAPTTTTTAAAAAVSSTITPTTTAAAPTPTPTPTTTPTPTPTTTTEPTTTSAASSPTTNTPVEITTTADVQPLGGLSRFLSDLIQIPIAVMRSVGALLSNTFHARVPTGGVLESAVSTQP